MSNTRSRKKQLDNVSTIGSIWSPEAEQAVLSALLVFDCIDEAIEIGLDKSDFYNYPHAMIFEAIYTLHKAGTGTDVIAVGEKLKALGTLEKAGGFAYLAELSDAVATPLSMMFHAEIIKKYSIQRQLIASTDQIRSLAISPVNDIEDLLGEAESLILGVRDNRSKDSLRMIDDWGETFRKLDERSTSWGTTGVPYGFIDLDKLTSGGQPGDLIILAGRPSMGKTSLALEVAIRAAMPNKRDHGGGGREEYGIAFFSMEMSREQIKQRLLSMIGNVELNKIKTGQGLDSEDRRRLSSAAEKIMSSKIYVDDSAGLNVMEIRAKARRFKRGIDRDGVKVGWVIVDYIQLANGNGDSREQEVSSISRGLKALAKELGCPVLALSQLNRKVEERSDKKPNLSDLRESGAIEQDADLVMFVYREEQYEKTQANAGKAELLVRKHRQGECRDIPLSYAGSRVSFFSASKEENHEN